MPKSPSDMLLSLMDDYNATFRALYEALTRVEAHLAHLDKRVEAVERAVGTDKEEPPTA